MTTWKARVTRGFAVGIAMMSFIVVVNAALIGVAASRPVGMGTFLVGLSTVLGLALAALIAYWVYGLTDASYHLDRNALVIQWGTSKQVIPTSQIERVFTGDQLEGQLRFYGGRWPGHFVGYGYLAEHGETLFYATEALRDHVFVVTPGVVYSISPTDRDGFLESLQQRLEMGATQAVPQTSERPPILDWRLWRDPLALGLLGVAGIAFVLLLGLLTLRYPQLPILIPLHYAATGSPDRLGPRAEIFLLPLIGLVTLVTNTILGGISYPKQRVASYMLWGTSLLLQLLVWTATYGLLSRI